MPSQFFVNWISANFRTAIDAACAEILGRSPEVQFSIDAAEPEPLPRQRHCPKRLRPRRRSRWPRRLGKLPRLRRIGGRLPSSSRSSSALRIGWPMRVPRWRPSGGGTVAPGDLGADGRGKTHLLKASGVRRAKPIGRRRLSICRPSSLSAIFSKPCAYGLPTFAAGIAESICC